MSVTFDEEQQLARTTRTGVSGLYALVIRWGFAKDEKGANMVLLIVAGVCFVLAGFALFTADSSDTISPEVYQERAQSQQMWVQ